MILVKDHLTVCFFNLLWIYGYIFPLCPDYSVCFSEFFSEFTGDILGSEWHNPDLGSLSTLEYRIIAPPPRLLIFEKFFNFFINFWKNEMIVTIISE